MTPMPTLLAQATAESSVSPGETAARGVKLITYRFGRLEQFDDPRLVWAGVAIVAALLAIFVAWQYRRERSAISVRMGVLLALLRLTAFAGAIIFFLAPLKRTDQELVTDSRVAILVDASQSMAVTDEPPVNVGGVSDADSASQQDKISRSEAIVRTLRDSPFVALLRQQHEVTLAVFDADFRRIIHWKRKQAGDANQREADQQDEDDANDEQALTIEQALAPLGVETRFGDALAATLNDSAGAPLAGVYAFTDGGQNSGIDPLATVDAALAAKAPVVTIGVGSTEPRRNLRLQELIAPSRAYPEDKITIRAILQGESYAGRSVTVELYSRQGAGEAPAVRIGSEQITFAGDAESVPLEFPIEPAEIGRLQLEARILAPEDDQYADDNQRTAEIDVVETSSRVLLIASGATRDYRFLRDQLKRDRHATVDVLLQMSPPGISQDADKILTAFPTTKEELFEYDCIAAFDPDWTQLDAQQVDLLEQWVAEEAGGMIVVAGPVHTASWVQSPEHGKVRALYPVEFQRRLTLLDDGLYGSAQPWPLEFTREGQEADFLWIGDTPEESRARWERFAGVFGCYAVRGPKPGAHVYARYSDPEAGLAVERPVYFADHFYGAGRVFYMGSGELWRLRTLDPGYYEALYTQLIRHVSQGRLLRGSSLGRLLVERDRYFVGDTVVVRAQLSTASREPYIADRVIARVTQPIGGDANAAKPDDSAGRNVELRADDSRPGSFVGQFTVGREGSYRIELPIPDAPGEQLEKRITSTLPDLELEETRRNEALLQTLAARTGGVYYASPQQALAGADDLEPAASLFESRAETRILRGKPDVQYAEWINQILLGVICGALSLEWLLRRLSKLA